MLIIIINQQQILVETHNDVVLLPNINNIKPIEHLLSPIYTTNNKFVAILNSPIPDDLSLFKLISLRQALNHFNMTIAKDIIYYQQLTRYYQTHKFCGICGNTTTRNINNKFVSCASCSHEIYPHIAPSIIVRIHKDDQILMARGINFPPKAWGLIAGFVEIGESLEETVIREVREETNLEITDIKYWGSQPWPFPDVTLMVGFTAKYQSGEIKPDINEIEDAGFFDKNNLPGKPASNYSLGSQMINEFIETN